MILSHYVIPSSSNVINKDKVKDFINDHGQWNIEKLIGVISQPPIDKILSIAPLERQADPDIPMWNYGKDSNFTTKSAYLCIRNLDNNSRLQVWDSIWKGNNQQRYKVLLWRLCHNSLPTRSKTASWSGAIPNCPLCKVSMESNLHANRVVNETEFVYPNEPHRVILSIAKNQMVAWNLSCGLARVLGWKKPEDGWVKVNTDGAVCRESNLGGCGGIIRDSNGFKLAWKLGFHKVILENDSQEAINCLQIDPNMNFGSYPAVNIVKNLLSKSWVVQIKHTPRSANKCADLLAKNSLSSNSRLVILDCIPDFVRAAMSLDAHSSNSPRDPGG
ncbi:ribonuclease H [Senna tora]|uniref:Ribonuclease H n=1 Tax=Senna tora TaxID=362788 RepID=A0A834XHD9_9FABA|nr:ribonuclease H [Senna tora]